MMLTLSHCCGETISRPSMHGEGPWYCDDCGQQQAKNRRDAYRKGWQSAGRSYDMDACQDRFTAKYGASQVGDWIAGWSDRATDSPFNPPEG